MNPFLFFEIIMISIFFEFNKVLTDSSPINPESYINIYSLVKGVARKFPLIINQKKVFGKLRRQRSYYQWGATHNFSAYHTI